MVVNVWLSVSGSSVIYPCTIVRCKWTDTFGIVIRKLSFPEETVVISCHIAQLVKLCDQFELPFVCYYLLLEQEKEVVKSTERKNAFKVLMESPPVRLLPQRVNILYCSYEILICLIVLLSIALEMHLTIMFLCSR